MTIMTKKQYTAPSSYCKMMNAKSYLISGSIREYNGDSSNGVMKTEGVEFGYSKERDVSYGSTFSDDISTGIGDWGF